MLIATVMSALLVACNKETTSGQSVGAHEDRAQRYIQDRQFKAADLEARNVIARSPDSKSGHLLRMQVSNLIGDFNSALQRYNDIPDLLSRQPEILLSLVESYIGLGKPKSAQAILHEVDSAPKAKVDAVKLERLRGMLLRLQGKAEEAERHYAALVESNPEHIDVLLDTAELAILQNNSKLAEQLLGRATQLEADNPRLLFMQGVLAVQTDQLALAELKLQKAEEILQADDVFTNQRLAVLAQLEQLMSMQGRSVEALAYEQKLARQGSSLVGNRLEEAYALLDGGDLEGAWQIASGVVEQIPEHPSANLLLATIDARQGNLPGAADRFNRHIDFELNSREMIEMAVQSHLRSGRAASLLQRIEDYRGLQQDGYALNAYARALAAGNREQEAVVALERSIEIEPDYLPSYLLLNAYYESVGRPASDSVNLLERGLTPGLSGGESAQRTGVLYLSLAKSYVAALLRAEEQTKAQEFVLAEIEASQASAEALHVAAAHALLKKDYERAKTYANASLEKDPADAQLWMALAAIERSLNEPFEKVLDAAQQALQLTPDKAQAYRVVLALAENQTESEQTAARVEAVVDVTQNPLGLRELARNYLATNDLENATRFLQRFRDARKDLLAAPTLGQKITIAKAVEQLEQGNNDEARALLQTELEKTPDSPELLSYLIRLETAVGNFPKAHQYAAQLERIEPIGGLVHDAEVFRAANDMDSAIARYLEAWDLTPGSELALQIYPMIAEHQPSELENFMLQWEQELPNHPERLRIVSSGALQSGDFDAAIELTEKLVTVEPGDPIALNNLAWLYQNAGDTRAVGVAEKAYRIAPEQVQVIDTYAWVLAENGEVERAISLFEAALELEPDNVAIQDNLRKAQEKL